jgi:phage baseplate assembly protein V
VTDFARSFARLRDKIALLAGRVIIKRTDTSDELMTAQVTGLEGEVHDSLEVMSHYGLASRPLPDAEATVVSVGGVRSNAVIIATGDRRYRIELAEGEVALHDDLGQVVHLKRSGILIESPLKVDIEAPTVTVTANEATIDADATDVTGNLNIGGNLVVAGTYKLGAGATKAVKLADNSNGTKGTAE